MIGVAIYNHLFEKNGTGFLHVLASAGHPQGKSLCISEGVHALTLLVIFLLYYDKCLQK
jgi:hypothetical protein